MKSRSDHLMKISDLIRWSQDLAVHVLWWLLPLFLQALERFVDQLLKILPFSCTLLAISCCMPNFMAIQLQIELRQFCLNLMVVEGR